MKHGTSIVDVLVRDLALAIQYMIQRGALDLNDDAPRATVIALADDACPAQGVLPTPRLWLPDLAW